MEKCSTASNRPEGAASACTMERLETRAMLAGNVTVAVLGGMLVITGDENDNGISLDAKSVNVGQITVRGDAGTSINGVYTPAYVSGLRNDVKVRLGGGDDSVRIGALRLPGHLSVDLDAGDDRIVLDSTSISGQLSIEGKQGQDTVDLINLTVGGEARISGGSDDDILTVQRCSFTRDFFLKSYSGHDSIAIFDSLIQGQTNNDADVNDLDSSADVLQARYTFRNGAQGWQAGFSDYPVGQESFYNLGSRIAELPDGVSRLGGTGYLVRGVNHSDDLFMFLKRRMTAADGIAADTDYEVRFTIVVASNAPTGSVGIGGSPGDSVYLKAGASQLDPANDGDTTRSSLNIDKGDQAVGGADVSLVGTIANGLTAAQAGDVPAYRSLRRRQVHTSRVTSDSSGRLSVVVGTDSGFEGRTALYYQRIDVTLVPLHTA